MSFFQNVLKGKRAVIMSRVSTEDQAERGYSLDVQDEHLLRFCERYEINVVLHLREEGASAKTFDRPEFNRFLALTKEVKSLADYFLIVKWDRFSRNMEQALAMISRLAKQGIEVNSTDQWIDYEDPNHTISLAIHLATPQVENDNRSNKVFIGMRRAQQEGNWVSKPPKGYKRIYHEKRRSEMILDEDAPLIREAFERISEGVFEVESVRREMEKKGFACSRSHFYSILRNVVYIGKITVPAHKDEVEELVDANHEALVSEDVFWRVQNVLQGKVIRKVTHYEDENFVLRGFLLCRDCGNFLTASYSKSAGKLRYPYYHCRTPCKWRFRADFVNQIFIEFISSFVFPEEVTALYFEVMRDIFSELGTDKKHRLKAIEKQLEELEPKLLNVELKYAEGEIEKDSFSRVKAQYQKEIFNLKSQKTEIKSMRDDYTHYLEYGISLLSHLDQYYKDADFQGKRCIISSTFGEKILFDGNKCRTFFMNEVVACLTRFEADLRVARNSKSDAKTSLVLSGTPKATLAEHLKRLYSLHRCIKLTS